MTGFLVVVIIILALVIIALHEITLEQSDLIERQRREIDRHFWRKE